MPQIKLGQNDYSLRFDMLALKRFKQATGKDLILGQASIGTDEYISLTYCALQSGAKFAGKQFDLSEEDVASLLTPKHIKEVFAAMNEELKAEAEGEGTGE